MPVAYQNAFTALYNRLRLRFDSRHSGEKLLLGVRVSSRHPRSVGIDLRTRREHLGIVGKTGTGKTSLLRYLCTQDIRRGHGFAFFDLHGDTTPFLLGVIAEEEKRRGIDLSSRTILIDPSDRERSVGLNILEASDTQAIFVEISETVAILKHRWKLDALGVRTDELLRHSLFVLGSNRLTLLEIGPLLTSDAFRASCVRATPPGEARSYFETRYDPLSPQNQAVYREAILNKVSVYAADPHFRHLLGQERSTLRLKEAVDRGYWVLFNLEKGRLGDEAATIGALLLAKLKHAILGRSSRRLFSLYCDELQNLVAFDSAIDVLLSEARKFGVSVVSANQYLDQYPSAMRAAMLAMGTHAFFQLSGLDAERIAHFLGQGRLVADRLRLLPKRHALLRLDGAQTTEVKVPEQRTPSIVPVSLIGRVRDRWTLPRTTIEARIRERHQSAFSGRKETLGNEWK
jgi:Type IV secretory pathway, VirB4 components